MPGEYQVARQPFTFAGVARYAHAWIGRLLLAAFLFGGFCGIAVAWLAARCWAPVIDEAVAALPANSSIKAGALQWPERGGRLLGANEFLSVAVVLQQAGGGAPVDITLELHSTQLVLRSIFGKAALPYPVNIIVDVNRNTLEPIWGAWRAPSLFSLIPGTAVGLMLTWSVLAIPYGFVARALGGLLNRDLNFRSAWKMCVAAQFSGSLLMAFGLTLYAAGQVSLLFVLIMLAAHFVPTLLFVLVSPFLVRKLPRPSSAKNPFNKSGDAEPRGRNPFAS